jgi:peroxiredoxin
VQPGEPAPEFSLPAVHREGSVSTADYIGRTPVLLALFRGLYCPYCRWHVSRLNLTAPRLKEAGVETVAVIAAARDRARMYYRLRPLSMAIAADPDLVTHHAYGVPQMAPSPEMRTLVRDKAAALLVERQGPPVSGDEALNQLDRLDGYARVEDDLAEGRRHGIQFTAQFLIDRDGIVRWTNVECARDGLAAFEKFPTQDELLTASQRIRNITDCVREGSS